MQTYAINNLGQPTYVGGTSFAAPVISGLAALFKSTQPIMEWGDPLRYYDADAFMSGLNRTSSEWNDETGWGVPDAYWTLWLHACVRYDFNVDDVVDILDLQGLAWRFGAYNGSPRYHERYDVEPALPDGDVDIKDIQRHWAYYFGARCPS